MRICAILIIVSLLKVCQSDATTKNPALSGIVAYEPLQDSHLIIRGTVAAVRQESIALSDWFSKQPSAQDSGMRTEMESIDVTVAEVLKGRTANRQVTFMVADGWPFSLGQEVIICARQIEGRMTTALFTNAYIGMFIKGEGDDWVKCEESNLQPEEKLSYSDLLQQIELASLANVTNAADLIVRGMITGVSEESYDAVGSKTGKLKRYKMAVSEIMKGKTSGGEVEFVISRTNATYVPAWHRTAPRGIAVGQEWIVFLRHGELGYYLFSGPNSALMVKGNDLIYDMAVAYPQSVDQASKLIRAEVSDEYQR